MQIYFDESGDFRTAIGGGQKFSFIVGIVVPETSLEKLKCDFDWIVSRLRPGEFVKGEPKGSRLSVDHRRLLLEILKAHRDVMLIPLTVNLGSDDPAFFATAPARIRSLIESNLLAESSSMSMEERAELARRFGRLSAPVLVRLVAYGIAVLKGIEAIACRYHCERFHANYDPIVVTFDRAGRPDNREELVFRASLFGWIERWSRTVPLRIPASLGECHPLLARYAARVSDQWVFDLKKMLAGRILFEDSKASWQIQLADFVANTWSQTIGDHEGRTGCRTLFLDLYRKSALPNETPLGVVAPTDRTEIVSAPQYLEVFARMVLGESKILPCE